ncbi:MAG: hypothetical protein AAGD28_32900, partial [Bacteroidota bacterium]
MKKFLLYAWILCAAIFLSSCGEKPAVAQEKTGTQTDIEAAKALLKKQSSGKKVKLGKEKLSDYGFFLGELKDLTPADGVLPYELNTPLFSDYAHKLRFFKVPEGTKAVYREKDVLDFPIGTYIIKNFYYYLDESQPEKGRRIMETRLLLHEKDGWKTLPSY